jgi:uroporphyrinogen-III synthase
VVFVSPNAAEQFFALQPAGAVWPETTTAGSTGPGTSRVLRAQGVPPAGLIEPAADAPQFDSEALWERLRERDWRGARVAIVRGDGGRDWLARTLAEHGAQMSFVQAYRRSAPAADAPVRERLDDAIARPAQHLWFFSSSEAIDHLVALAPGTRWDAARALTTHARIAARARAAGFAQVSECRPTFDAVVACIQSIDP